MKFEKWIRGFESRYTKDQLWYMKWIWGILAPKIEKLEKENDDLRLEVALLKVDKLRKNDPKRIATLREDLLPKVEEE